MSEQFAIAAGDYVVYPTHGVGRVLGIENQDLGGVKVDVIAVHFESDRMTLRVPVNRAEKSGLRKLSSKKLMDDAFKVLKQPPKAKNSMWGKRAQEYEAKINSGDLSAIAEVVRDLHRSTDQSEQSFSERQIYQSAFQRLAREIAAIQGVKEKEAEKQIGEVLNPKKDGE